MLKEKVREVDEAQTLRQSKWRNIYFTKDGKSWRGAMSFDTKEQAIRMGEETVAKAKGLIPNSSPIYGGWQFVTLDGTFKGRDFSWYLPMPEMGEA